MESPSKLNDVFYIYIENMFWELVTPNLMKAVFFGCIVSAHKESG